MDDQERRDLFAGMAMLGMYARGTSIDGDRIVQLAADAADLLIAELDRTAANKPISRESRGSERAV